MISSWADYFHQVSWGLNKKCGIFTYAQFLEVGPFFLPRTYFRRRGGSRHDFCPFLLHKCRLFVKKDQNHVHLVIEWQQTKNLHVIIFEANNRFFISKTHFPLTYYYVTCWKLFFKVYYLYLGCFSKFCTVLLATIQNDIYWACRSICKKHTWKTFLTWVRSDNLWPIVW